MSRAVPKDVLRIRIPHGERYAMGPGKADLLEAIEETRSIAEAGRSLGMSYWKTRRLLDEMAACFKAPVVETTRGGGGGGGSSLTKLGREALARYRAMQARAEAAIAGDLKAYRRLLARKA